jgi:hypothetical protein
VGELFAKDVVEGGFATEAIPVLREHRVYATARYEIAYFVHTRALKRSTAESGIGNLFDHVEAFTLTILSQGVKLLGDAEAVLFGLLSGRYAGVKNGSLRTMPVSVSGHASFLS